MILTISTTRPPATDLGYLLHKHPAKTQSFDLPAGRAHVFYTEATDERCTAALLLDVDPIKLVRGPGAFLEDYVNDRAYVSSSLMSVAIARTLGTAMAGTCKERPQAAATPMPLTATVAAIPCRGGDELLARLFEPLGYTVQATEGAASDGPRSYWNLVLTGDATLSSLLTHIYVLLPVADNRKHYWFGDAEVEKLMQKGRGWLDAHPEKNLIVKRFLGHRRTLTKAATRQLAAQTKPPADPENGDPAPGPPPEREHPNLHQQRLEWAVEALRKAGARTVADLGCGEGKLLRLLIDDAGFTKLTGADASAWSLQIARRKLKRAKLAGEPGRLELIQTALTFRDERIEGHDAAVLLEVIEHIEPHRLDTVEQVLFGIAKPRTVLMSTPNREYNVLYERMPEGTLRHRDHKFEWTRDEFRQWAETLAGRYGYTVEFGGVGDVDDTLGQPTQTGVFTRCA